jgi:ABC-type nitrate/sulfonate/bicarbonate transport system permease component
MATSVIAPARPVLTRTGRAGARGAVGWRVLGVAVVLLVWQLLALAIDYTAILPGPIKVVTDFATSFVNDPGLSYLGVRVSGYGVNVAWTVGMATAAWLVGSAAGAIAGLLSARVQWVRNVTEPVLFVFGAVPALVLAPFCLIWFGQGPGGKFALVAFYCFVTVGLIAQAAALALPPVSEEYGAMLGVPAAARFWHIVVPATLPAVLAGLRVALSTAIAVQATVELLGSQTGAGRLIALRATQGDVSAVLGLSLAIGIAAILLDLLLQRLVRLFTRWQ